MGWLAVVKEVLAAFGSLSVVLVPWLGRKLAQRAAAVREVEETAARIAEGLKYIEAAVASNKESGPGAVITRTIRQYGPCAVMAVDRARDLAHQIAEEAWRERERELIAREHAARERELAARRVGN